MCFPETNGLIESLTTRCIFRPAITQYQSGVFEVCDSDDMDPVGIFTGTDGVVSTYSQPAVVTSLPSVRTPSSSNCQTFQSSDLYAAAPTGTLSSGASSASGASNTGSGSGSATVTTKATGSTTKATGSTGLSLTSAQPTGTSNAAMRAHSAQSVAGLGVWSFMAIVVSILAGLGAIIIGM